jgi:hypothetical protein
VKWCQHPHLKGKLPSSPSFSPQSLLGSLDSSPCPGCACRPMLPDGPSECRWIREASDTWLQVPPASFFPLVVISKGLYLSQVAIGKRWRLGDLLTTEIYCLQSWRLGSRRSRCLQIQGLVWACFLVHRWHFLAGSLHVGRASLLFCFLLVGLGFELRARIISVSHWCLAQSSLFFLSQGLAM